MQKPLKSALRVSHGIPAVLACRACCFAAVSGRSVGLYAAFLAVMGKDKAPDGSGAGDYLKRRAALKSVASGSRSRKSRSLS